MKVRCNAEISLNNLKELLSDYHFCRLDVCAQSVDEILTETNLGKQLFLTIPDGLLISSDNPGRYGGVTYTFGAATVYWTEEDKQRTGKLQNRVLKLRVIHELLHHFDKPADDIEEWFDNHPFLEVVYKILGHSSGENIFGMYVQDIFYRELCLGLNEERFNEQYCIEDRDFRGRL